MISFESYTLPRNIGDFSLKRMPVGDFGHRYIYTSNRTYIVPFKIAIDAITQEELEEKKECYNKEVLFEIEGEKNYAEHKIKEFAYCYEKMSTGYSVIQPFNTVVATVGDSQNTLFLKKNILINLVEDSERKIMVAIVPELDFSINWVIEKLEEAYIAFRLKTKKEIAIYYHTLLMSPENIVEKFKISGWEIDLIPIK